MLIDILFLLLRLTAYVLIQVLFLQHLNFFDAAFCFLYISFILFLPIKLDRLWVLFLSFLIGILIDIFYDTLGIHTAACVLIGFLRGFLITLYGLDSNDEIVSVISIRSVKIQVFLSYVLILTFIHHLLLFSIEANHWGLFQEVMVRSFLSTIFTFTTVFIVQYIFYSLQQRSKR